MGSAGFLVVPLLGFAIKVAVRVVHLLNFLQKGYAIRNVLLKSAIIVKGVICTLGLSLYCPVKYCYQLPLQCTFKIAFDVHSLPSFEYACLLCDQPLYIPANPCNISLNDGDGALVSFCQAWIIIGRYLLCWGNGSDKLIKFHHDECGRLYWSWPSTMW